MTDALPTLTDLRPGDLAFCPIGGFIPGVIPVGAGQILFAPWKQRLSWRRWRMVRHAGTVTEASSSDFFARDHGAHGIGPMMAQAMPSGFEQVELGASRWTDSYVYIRPAYKDGQAEDVAHHARQMVARKVPYGFEDYAAITAHRTHVPVPHLDRFIARVDADGYPRRSICSQAVDAQLTLSGFRVFSDGRLPQDVMPAELYLRLLELRPAAVFIPGHPVELPQARLTVAQLSGTPAEVPIHLLT